MTSLPSYRRSADQSPDLTLVIDLKEYGLSGDRRKTPWQHPQLRLLYRNLRSGLDLEQIRQQATDGLRDILKVRQVLCCSYGDGDNVVRVCAESRSDGVTSRLGELIPLEEAPYLERALAQGSPIIAQEHWVQEHWVQEHGGQGHGGHQGESLLVVATGHMGIMNGLLVLVRSVLTSPDDCTERAMVDPHRTGWSNSDTALAQEVAEQLGVAIAHAQLHAENQALQLQLQQVCEDFLHKQQELEDAHHQAEEASRLKSEFLANTSHELRTPLNGMIGFLRLVLDGMADSEEEQLEFVTEAHGSALLLLDIINDILDVAKIEAGKMELDLTAVALKELFEDVERKTSTQANHKGLHYTLSLPPTHDEIVVYGDYQRLLQVMLNLVGNAVKFTNEGGITITAKIVKQKVTVQELELPGYVKVGVADTGIGVSLEKQAKLFKSFSQVDSSRTRQYGGTGLGLVISQKLVEAMGGTVNFYSMGEGLGSTVTFTIPLYQEPVMRVVPEDAEAGD